MFVVRMFWRKIIKGILFGVWDFLQNFILIGKYL